MNPRARIRKPAPAAPVIEQAAAPALPHFDRLQKVLAEAGVGSRRHCEEFILGGRVSVDGRVVRELGFRIDPVRQLVEFDGEPVRQESKVYWLVNKPPGVLSTSRDTHGRPTVLDMIPDIGRRIYAVGRLDEDSTGLLLITNDGDMAHRLTHPKFGVPKTYEVLVAGRVSNEEIAQLRQGIWLSEGKAKATEIHFISGRGKATRLHVVLAEGRNREVRRMFAKVGHKVMKLERIAIGPIRIRKLQRGQSRPVTPEELQLLRELVGAPKRRTRPRPVSRTPGAVRRPRTGKPDPAKANTRRRRPPGR